MKKEQIKKLNNKGVSLLEVIVAVSIFSIAAIVLLQGFVTSGRVNRKSNLYLEATSTAQNLMEEIKSKSFEEVALAFNYPIDKTTGHSRFAFLEPHKGEFGTVINISEKLKTVRDGKAEYTDVRLTGEENKITASIISTDDGKTYRFNPREKGENASKYYYQMTNVKNFHETFDVLAEFDGSRDSGYKKQNNLSKENKKNDYEIPNIARLDSKTNGFLIMPKNWDQEVMDALVAAQLQLAKKKWNEETQEPDKEPELQAMNPEEVYKKTKRTLFIKLEEDGGVITAKARYTLNAYSYVDPVGGKYGRMDLCSCNGDPEKAKTNPDECCTYTSAYVPFYSSDAGEELKNIFVFYYPNYESSSSAFPLDEIIVDNRINYPVNLYISKQREETLTSAQEMNYRMNLTIQEDPSSDQERPNSSWNTNPSLFRSRLKLRSNLNRDISREEPASIDQMGLVYTDGKYSFKNTNARSVLDFNGLDDRTARDRIYTAKISIYRQGAAEKNFPEEERILTLDGSKEN